jgi:DUF1009 family protein
VLAKGPKPGQELRVDMPAIGPRTVELAAAAGLAGLAVEAGAVLLLDRDEAIQAADRHGIAIEGLPMAPTPPPAPAEPAAVRVVGREQPNRRDATDIEKGLAVVERLAPFDTGKAAVVARAYILAIAAGEPASEMLDRTRALRQWGVGANRRVGVLAYRAGSEDGDGAHVQALLDRAAAQGLAGVAVAGPPQALAAFERAGPIADRHGLVLVTRGSSHDGSGTRNATGAGA